MMKKDELIDKYFSHQLSEEDQIQFDSLLQEDENFRAEFAFHQDLRSVVFEEEKEALKDKITKWRRARNKRVKILAAFLIVLLTAIFITFYLYRHQQVDKAASIYATYFEPYPNDFKPVLRAANDDNLTQGLTAYEAGEYNKAVDLLEEALLQSPDPTVSFYQALSFAITGDEQSAITSLTSLLSQDFKYRDKALYYLALLQIKNENLTQAIDYLQQFLASTTDDSLRSKATEVLQSVSEMEQ